MNPYILDYTRNLHSVGAGCICSLKALLPSVGVGCITVYTLTLLRPSYGGCWVYYFPFTIASETLTVCALSAHVIYNPDHVETLLMWGICFHLPLIMLRSS